MPLYEVYNTINAINLSINYNESQISKLIERIRFIKLGSNSLLRDIQNPYHTESLIEEEKIEDDPNCLALLKHYHSLIPMAMEVRKPIFLLKPADGAIGAHNQAVTRAYLDFKLLSAKILQRVV